MSPELLAERLAGIEGPPADICLLAELHGDPVGLAVGTTQPLVERSVGDLACVAVVPAARGRGIGSSLLAEVERKSTCCWLDAVEGGLCHAHPSNPRRRPDDGQPPVAAA